MAALVDRIPGVLMLIADFPLGDDRREQRENSITVHQYVKEDHMPPMEER
jgi:hypothetical protein